MAPAPHRVTSNLKSYATPDAGENVASVPEHAFFDLIVIGSGPAALSAVTRVLETRPAALYTEDERHHLHWIKHSSRAAPTIRATRSGPRLVGKHNSCEHEQRISILIIDRFGAGWLGLWHRLFAAYEISHLRSPMFFHPDPADLGGLLEWTTSVGRYTIGHPSVIYERNKRTEALPELIEIPGVVGKEVSKHKHKMKRRHSLGHAINERDRRDYATPGAQLFRDFCDDIVSRYGLVPEQKDGRLYGVTEYLNVRRDRPACNIDSALVAGDVCDLDYGTVNVAHCGRVDPHQGFSVRLGDGTLIGAKAVISAVGTGGRPHVPEWLAPHKGLWMHSAQLATPGNVFPPPELVTTGATLVIIGGGLSSAQICDVAIRRGVKRVVLLLRGHLKAKPFDLGIEWVGKFANLHKMQFWQCSDPAERHAMILEARNGGSLTPAYAKLMMRYASEGLLEIRTHTQVANARQLDNSWCLELDRTAGDDDTQLNCQQQPGSRETLDAGYIVSCTGAKLGFSSLPFMQTLAIKVPVPEVGGLPVVTEDLQYGGIPLFCVGAYSALQIGPPAFNLGGMREAAERVAVRLGELQAHDEKRGSSARCVNTYSHFNYNVLVEDA